MSTSSGIYRPSQWSNGPAMVSITQAPTQGQSNSPGGNVTQATPGQIAAGEDSFVLSASGSTQTTYVFDAVLDLEHEQRLEKTHHPVQTGADISSHAYLMPARLTMYVGMSDAMAAYSTGLNNSGVIGGTSPANVAPFTGSSSSKSVNAYQTMLSLQAARQPLTVTTRLRTYSNMVIMSVSPREDFKTITGLRMRIEFEQILTGSVSSSPITARPDATQNTGLGTVNPTPIAAPTQNQFQVPQASVTSSGAVSIPPASPSNSQSAALGLSPNSMTTYLPPAVDVPGAGSYSSVPGQQALP